MKYLIVGLGNIGAEYAETRHNVGFMALDRLAKKNDVSFDSDRLAFKAEFKHKGRQIHLIKPTTYMNLSGKAVNYWMKELKIERDNVLVIVDDLAIPFGALRMRGKGSAAGHNGLKDIEAKLGGNNYPRLRFGIGDDYPKGRQIDFVLGEFSQDEQIELDNTLLDRCGDMILSFCSIGIARTMNQFNK
ncbi:aminoacyl-tRNA hydrolase [Sediminitomix flava]|uniref:Peptidyl-tRNA hydrolase n=1 Tax=Sediminitomix flava TaxID=379075 RepID=A0A315ZDX4_SEDFL|nr:aminoacyl-tRNA hydrolase [Sediminitomix flava]PWJ43353.1 peptidyl-tRNA hydrolase [Sediminitomix flava]